VDPDSGQAIYQLQHDFGLFEAMGGAGSSYGIVTEFLYRIYPRLEWKIESYSTRLISYLHTLRVQLYVLVLLCVLF
jgi:hypothetical protein